MANFRTIFSLFLSLLPIFLYSHQTQYSKLQAHNLASLEWVDEEWPQESFHDYLVRCLDYQKNLQELKKRRIVFKLFHELNCNKECDPTILHDLITAQDLNLLCGQKVHEPYVAMHIDRTKTECGRIFLYGLIGSPTDTIEVLRHRTLEHRAQQFQML